MSLKTKIITAILIAALSSTVHADRMEGILLCFDKEQTLENANAFFKELEAEGFVEEPMTAASNEHGDSIRAAVWYWAAEWYYDQQEYGKAEEYGKRALPMCEKAGDKTMEADCASLLSIINVRQGKFQEAAVYAKHCNELDIESGDKDNIASSYNTMAGIYMSAHEPREAEKYILKAMEYAEQTDNLPRQAVVYGMASEVYQNLRDAERSLEYADHSLETERRLGRTDRIAVRQAQRAPALIGLKRYEEAEAALAEAIPVLKQMNDQHSTGIALVQMGDVKRKLQQDEAATGYYDEAVEIFSAQNDLYNLSQAYDGLREAWRKRDAQRALEYNDKYLRLQDSLYDKQTGELLSKYAAEYDNYALQEQNTAENKKHRRNIAILIAIFCLTVIALGGAAAIYYIRSKKRVATIKREMEDVRKALMATSAVAQTKEKKENTTAEDEDNLLVKVVEEVQKALGKRDLSVETIAKNIGMSERTLRRRMQALTGSTPKEFVSAIQMEKARELLLGDKQMKIEDLAVECGFEDASSFSHTFSRIFGMSPTQFRKQNSAE